jgi:hypothetical protein
MSYKPVTDGQMKCAQKMANEKKIGRERFQIQMDTGGFGRYLDSLVGEITAPPGARICIIPNVEVTLNQEWQEMVDTVYDDTLEEDHNNSYNIRRVGHLYLPTGKGKVMCDYVALRFVGEEALHDDPGDADFRPGPHDHFEKALAWAKKQGLENTVPREVFAISRDAVWKEDDIDSHLIATTVCVFNGEHCALYCDGCADVRPLVLLGLESDSFIFRKPSILGA